jgi:hypothetical protein
MTTLSVISNFVLLIMEKKQRQYFDWQNHCFWFFGDKFHCSSLNPFLKGLFVTRFEFWNSNKTKQQALFYSVFWLSHPKKKNQVNFSSIQKVTNVVERIEYPQLV